MYFLPCDCWCSHNTYQNNVKNSIIIVENYSQIYYFLFCVFQKILKWKKYIKKSRNQKIRWIETFQLNINYNHKIRILNTKKNLYSSTRKSKRTKRRNKDQKNKNTKKYYLRPFQIINFQIHPSNMFHNLDQTLLKCYKLFLVPTHTKGNKNLNLYQKWKTIPILNLQHCWVFVKKQTIIKDT